jgi:cytochrome P450
MRSFTSGTPQAALLPRASLGEVLGIVTGVIGPSLMKGVIRRRPAMVGLAERWDLDRRSVRRMQELRRRHGAGPLLIGPVMGRRWALVLAPEHVRRVLEETPEPFTAASTEKRAALSHFQPEGVLISHGADRVDRRRFVEAVLDADRPVHHLAGKFLPVVAEEAALLCSETRRYGALGWKDFDAAWSRVVRRVVFGDAARDDEEVTNLVERLRSHANWAFLRPRSDRLRHRFFDRLNHHLARAEPGSLASVMASVPKSGQTAPSHQIPQWLFAFDPAGMTTFRCLAVLATHPAHAERAREEIRQRDRSELSYVRACVLDTVRLWPTAPLVLRESTGQTTWEQGRMPPRTGLIIVAPFFHRDSERVPFADRFAPEVWLDGVPEEDWPFIPFSAGPARCPGRELVLLLTSTMLAELLEDLELRLKPPARLDPHRPLPATLNNYALGFEPVF